MKKLLCYFVLLGCASCLTHGSGAFPYNSTFVDIPPNLIQPTPPPIPEKSRIQSDGPWQTEETFKTATNPERWQRHRIRTGDNLFRIFARYGIDKQILYSILSSTPLAKELRTVNPGKEIELRIDENGILHHLRYRPNQIDLLEIVRTESGYKTSKTSRPFERRITHAKGLVRSSFYRDGKTAGLDHKLIAEITKIFAWDVDFALDVRPGDEFTVLYEKLFLDGQFYGSGKILAAEFVNRGHAHTAVYFTRGDGVSGYYTPEGKSLRKAFLRTPVRFARISSPFNFHRRHPVLNRIRAHKGVDYAARTGTPVLATGDGKITFRGRKRGYGRVVMIQHGEHYTTVYAHLSKFGAGVPGAQVRQGQTIGYVGASGLATGPHLHYEFRINGVHQNPLTVKLPGALSIGAESLARFRTSTAPILAQLEVYRSPLLAQADAKRPGIR
ncbi:MAG: peptidoglycan DD-metalloendopeptidase family protein [Gammaproteobacteria bacterium]